jgi:hypothetical protein
LDAATWSRRYGQRVVSSAGFPKRGFAGQAQRFETLLLL